MNAKPTKKSVPVQSAPKTLQQKFDKWFLPFVFVTIGCVMCWALWREIR